jgi:hypothetical protein
MRAPQRKYVREEMVAYIHGIDAKGDVAHILVHKKGESVRFSGELGEHSVAPSNRADLEKWVREAETVWELDDVMGVPRGWMHVPETLEKLKLLDINAAKRKKDLTLSHVPQT